ncbi:MAG: dienelactone hydrolase family protein [Calditrichaeota bacterium]|nr:dienelactone hydrolase family protein [Calditrichota bacterium]
MKFSKIVFFCIFLFLYSCSINKTTNVVQQSITIPLGEGKSFPAATYQIQGSGQDPVLIIAFAENLKNVRDVFSRKIANRGYFVLSMQRPLIQSNASGQDSLYIQELAAAVHAVKSFPNIKTNKIGLWGDGLFGIAALQVASNDSDVAAIITVGSAKYYSPQKSHIFDITPPRPLLIIESTLKPKHPEKAKMNYFTAAKQPKKLVWLATLTEGARVLSMDMEPIVRRTTLMLIDRYLKGK